MKKYFAETGRGLNDNQISAIKIADAQDENFLQGILDELKKSDTEIFMGVRNGYFNLYCGGASIGKFNFDDEKIINVEIHRKYIGENYSGYLILPVENSPFNFKKICDNVKSFNLNSPKRNLEKQLQQRLVMANNLSAVSAWYFIDIEYVMQRQNKYEPNFGRSDIVAISRRPIGGKYKLLMIELKIGSGSFSTDAKNFPSTKLTAEELLGDTRNFGSGILGHFADFVRYKADKIYNCGDGFKGRFTKLRGEVVNILENYSALGILPYDINLELEDIFDEPTLVFLIYGGDISKLRIEQSFRRYVGGKACENLGGESEHSVAKACDENFIAQIFDKNIKCIFRDNDLIFSDEGISEAVKIF